MSKEALASIESIIESFGKAGFIADEELATILFLQLRLDRPLLIEGHTGVGKTEVAHVLAECLETELIRLQCYEGLDVHSAVYEWNYQRQLLAIKMAEVREGKSSVTEERIFGEDYLLERPLLRAIRARDKPPVLLVDEIDRADEEFEAYLLELLSVFQITIPELGTIRAQRPPRVILTSNRTRELSDALKRRCLYLWVDYPEREKELQIVHTRLPGVSDRLAAQVVTFVEALRQLALEKPPGIAETLDWARALLELEVETLDETAILRTRGCLLKSNQDALLVSEQDLSALLETR